MNLNGQFTEVTGREVPPTGTKLGEFRVVQAVWEEQKEQERVQWLFTHPEYDIQVARGLLSRMFLFATR